MPSLDEILFPSQTTTVAPRRTISASATRQPLEDILFEKPTAKPNRPSLKSIFESPITSAIFKTATTGSPLAPFMNRRAIETIATPRIASEALGLISKRPDLTVGEQLFPEDPLAFVEPRGVPKPLEFSSEFSKGILRELINASATPITYAIPPTAKVVGGELLSALPRTVQKTLATPISKLKTRIPQSVAKDILNTKTFDEALSKWKAVPEDLTGKVGRILFRKNPNLIIRFTRGESTPVAKPALPAPLGLGTNIISDIPPEQGKLVKGYVGVQKGKPQGKFIYLSENKGYAKKFGDEIKEYVIIPKNTFDLTPLKENSISYEKLKKFLKLNGIEIEKSLVSDDDIYKPAWQWIRKYPKIAEKIKDFGFDSIKQVETFLGKGKKELTYQILDESIIQPSQVTPSVQPSVMQALPATVPKPSVPPVTGTGEIKTRGLAIGVEEKAVTNKLTSGFGDLPEFQQVNMADQAKRVSDLLKQDPDLGRRVVMGLEPSPQDILPESFFVAVEDQAVRQGDVSTLLDLATKSPLTQEATTMGQRIKTLSMREPESPVAAIKDISRARESATKTRVKDIKKERKRVSDTIRQEVARVRPTRETWADFVKSLECV